ncbi:MAG TPA: MFS transporter [Gaiellaceae bacterium]|nr:MFS transporter [Gaiellaceae bacterium]
MLAAAASQAAVYVARPTTSYRLLALGDGALEVGLVTAAFAIIPLFLAIPLGRVTDRRHGLPLLLIGCGLQVGACLGLAVAGSTVTIAAASALLGLGHLGLALGVQDVIARESDPKHHDQHFGLLTAAVSLGQLAGPLLGGALLSESRTGLEAATTRAMLAAAGVAFAATVFAGLANERHRATRSPATSEAGRASVRRIITTRGVPTGIFASIAVLTAADVFTAYMPVLGEDRGIDPGLVGVILAVRAAASMASRIGIGPIVARVGRLRLISLSATSSAAALLAVTFTDNAFALAALAAVAGFGLGFGQPLSMTMVVQSVPERVRGTALAVRLTGNRVGQVAVPATAGAVAGSAGIGSVFWLLAGLLLASAVAVERQPDRRERVRVAPVELEDVT